MYNLREHWIEFSCVALVELEGDGYTLDVDTIHVARTEEDDLAYVGLLRNFYFDNYRFFDTDPPLPPGVHVNSTAQVGLYNDRHKLTTNKLLASSLTTFDELDHQRIKRCFLKSIS